MSFLNVNSGVPNLDGNNMTSGKLNERVDQFKSALNSVMPQNVKGEPKKVTNELIELALNQPSGKRAVNLLLNNSPVGLGNQPNGEDIENAGFTFTGTAFHIGAPKFYKSADGATITVYPGGGTAESGEDKRKIVYQTDRYTQEMFYDENGKLTKGEITIKDKVAGFTEEKYSFLMDSKGTIESVIR